MTALVFDLTAAQNALCRIDDGNPLPGDHTLAAQYERHCQQSHHHLQAALDRAEHDAWLAGQCRYCGPDGATGDCGDCPIPEHALAA